MSLCRENSFNDFLFVVSYSRTNQIKILTENHKGGVRSEKNYKKSSRFQPIKSQCSAGPGSDKFGR